MKLLSTGYKEVEVGGWRVLVGVGDSDALFPKQVHGGEIVEAKSLKNREMEADGVMLDAADGVVVGVVTADCVPVVIVTKEKAVVLHVSRKTLIRGLLKKVKECIRVEDILGICVGPHVCARHFVFETEGEEVREFMQKHPEAYERRGGRVYLSMRKALQVFFNKWGVSEDVVIEDGRCTYENDDLPSYVRWRENKEAQRLQHLRTIICRDEDLVS